MASVQLHRRFVWQWTQAIDTTDAVQGERKKRGRGEEM